MTSTAERAATAHATGLSITFDPQETKNVVRATGTIASGDNVEAYLSWTVVNRHTNWVDVICETIDGGDYYQLINTRQLNYNDSESNGLQIPPQLVGRRVHLFRWTPGFLNIPGSGGGEAQFTVPEGFVHLDVTIVG